MKEVRSRIWKYRCRYVQLCIRLMYSTEGGTHLSPDILQTRIRRTSIQHIAYCIQRSKLFWLILRHSIPASRAGRKLDFFLFDFISVVSTISSDDEQPQTVAPQLSVSWETSFHQYYLRLLGRQGQHQGRPRKQAFIYYLQISLTAISVTIDIVIPEDSQCKNALTNSNSCSGELYFSS